MARMDFKDTKKGKAHYARIAAFPLLSFYFGSWINDAGRQAWALYRRVEPRPGQGAQHDTALGKVVERDIACVQVVATGRHNSKTMPRQLHRPYDVDPRDITEFKAMDIVPVPAPYDMGLEMMLLSADDTSCFRYIDRLHEVLHRVAADA